MATIHVTVQRGDASISKKTKIRIERPAFIHLIQTDKPVYKPGQTGEAPDRSVSSALVNALLCLITGRHDYGPRRHAASRKLQSEINPSNPNVKLVDAA